MDAQLSAAKKVMCPFCGESDYTIYRREVKADHRVLNYCHCKQCGQHYQFGEDKAGKASVRRR